MNSTTSRQITVAEMAPHIHSFLPGENKVNKLTKWLIKWIKSSLSDGKIKVNDFLPLKGDLACHIGVSQGTVQNVFRLVEDAGYVKSKQRIGTYITNPDLSENSEKLASRREYTVEVIKKYILQKEFKVGDKLISIRKISAEINVPPTTVRLAINSLVSLNILEKKNTHFCIKNINYKIEDIQPETLAKKVADMLRSYVKAELKAGDKLPSNNKLAKKFNVSITTIHDAIKQLTKEGLLYTRRGKYGTVVLGETAEAYSYEKVEHKIRGYIVENCKVGDKLPAIKTLADMYKTSGKTVKRALDNLADDGYLTFSRGRYGGTFVMDIPQTSEEAYRWLAINSDYVQN